MKKVFAFLVLLLAVPVLAQPSLPEGMKLAEKVDSHEAPNATPLYKGQDKWPDTERWNRMFGDQISVRNISRPSLTPVLPDPEKANGAAVLVVPGGGFKFVSMSNEGWPVAKWLADRGIAAFVLKYRTNPTPADEGAFAAGMIKMFSQPAGEPRPAIEEPRATQDAIAALDMIRDRAEAWNVDPARVGMIGFSAGAMTALNTVRETEGDRRPAWIGYIYGPMAEIEVPDKAPPMFAALALDDMLFGKQGLGIVEAWQEAGSPVELHAYEKGDHGYGMGREGTTTTRMMDQYHLWLETSGWLTK